MPWTQLRAEGPSWNRPHGFGVPFAGHVNSWLGFVLATGVLEVGFGEQRYVAVAQYIERALPANAIVLSMQHSGTIWFYSGRRTIQSAALPPTGLQSAIEWLAANGHRPYIVLEDREEQDYRQHFADQVALGRLEIPMIAVTIHAIPIRVYDPLGPPGAAVPVEPIPVPREHRCVGPHGPWQRR